MLCCVPCWQHYCYKLKNHFKILTDFSQIFWYFSLKLCQFIFKTISYSPPDLFRWESYDFSSLNCPKPLKSKHVFWLGHPGPLNDFSKFFKHFSKIFMKFLSGKVLFVIFWHRMSRGCFFKFWHTLSLLCSTNSSISPNLKIYSLGKWLIGILEIFLKWPSSSHLSNGVLSIF